MEETTIMPKEPEVPAKGSNHKLWLVDVSIQWLLYPILIVYFLPILALAAAALITDGFTVQDESLSFARIMASDFYDSLRQTIGVIFVPFLTAYAVQAVSSQAKVPISTAALFFVLLTFFVITIVMYGLIDIKQITLDRNTVRVNGKAESLSAFFKTATTVYAKELLAYIAIVLGITLKK